ncbi:TIGR03617 family F420-dependent LLM class oxidoreductase [Gordonia aichiensis]|uniref:Putative oxidoreductase n=1 Tax=Gordonia aichiensis NBRC 108223 TaxID=1220583 RepID=L7KN09_9ACTN|nr:TIGR03617 family F420-dependent LLM class oxidoreductase [Gordonia aichiensis]GAC49078.1 putative oxidoreductase [Gordonia aichiensis NBRC 108223]
MSRVAVTTALFDPVDAAQRAAALAEAGASGVFTFEGPHDVFTPLAVAASVPDLRLLTNVAIAFPRNPIHLAHAANDLQLLSGGRFRLGLGTQIRPQIEKRFGAEFDDPVGRMADKVGAINAIFDAWETGAPLRYEGTYHRHTLMTPTFDPGPNPFGRPPVFVGALGPLMTRATATYADGLLVMPFNTADFLASTTIPNIRRGLSRRARISPRGFTVIPEVIVSVGDDHTAARRLLAFYGSTPAYRPVLAAHGAAHLQPALNALSKQGRWSEMPKLIDDDLLHTIAACGSAEDVARGVRARIDAFDALRDLDVLVDEVCVYQPTPIDVEHLAAVIDALA